ncbi:uncharacterized protein LOC116344486 [Contarinia nasturtii]|uniref:uncharacterized protein LOC116344486 n=1 Tax=Contarinia nasturtii TaxID=265458 RepID=UPI0012D39FAD|nr:uncharacterized protein LOC116344486 [Contarinia nasturtii]
MDFDTAKENIQPLASGRNAEHLETALHAESDQETQERLHEQRREFEKAIETYVGDDPLQPWYDYIEWVEQVYPKSGKESALHEILSKCLAEFEENRRYFQDRRMVKLYIKYIDSESNPPQFYEQLYNSGIGTMVADLYLCWAHYYDYCDNFEKAESVYRKGLDARAQPIELLEQAHRQFGFSMSQRILYKDESAQREFRSTMEEQRLALTSLRAHKHRHVGSIRTGSAVKSYNPGRVEQHGASSRNSRLKDNRNVQIFEDNGEEPTSPVASTSVVQSIINSTKKQENMREPGPWNKAKIKSNPLFSGASSTKPSFSILEDDNLLPPPIPLDEKDNNYARGIQLPRDFVRKNLPQEEFLFQLHRDDEPGKNTLYNYDKFMLFPAKDKCYSLEELCAYKWFKKNNIKNTFTETQAAIWENGHDIPLRLPPHFVRKNRKQDDWKLSPVNYMDIIENGQRKFGFDISLVYTPIDEFSPEEILQSKWLNGEMRSQKDAEMEITCGFERLEEIYNRKANRRSMILGGRKSMLPRKSNSPRKSTSRKSIIEHAPAVAPMPENEEEEPTTLNSEPPLPTGAVKKTSLPKRKSVYFAKTLETLTTIQETASPPTLRRKLNEDEETAESYNRPTVSKFNIFEDNEPIDTEVDDNMFKVPQAVPAQKSVFQDDLDGCTTQTFNFFIKSQSISTPKVEKQTAKMSEPENVVTKGLDFGSDSDTTPPSNEEQNAATTKQPFTCRLADMDAQYVLAEPPEIYRQKLSAIMETTEDGATISSLAATASSKSSSVEDFDFTKHTTQQSSVAMSTYRHHTMVNSTAAKMSSSTMSTTHRENETRKISALGFEIYQEEPPKPNESMPSVNVIAKPVDVSKALELQKEATIAFDKTLPPAGQFHIYEDEEKIQAAAIQAKKENSVSAKVNETTKRAEKSMFEISRAETEPSNWSSKTLTKNDATLTRRVSTAQEKSEKAFDSTLTSSTAIIPSMPHKPIFQILQEDTGLTIAPINFIEENTEKLPNFNANRTNFTQQLPPAFEPSIYMPELPEDTTKNMSKYFKANVSRVEPPPPALPPSVLNDQSVLYNKSVFLLPKEDTITDVFSTNFADVKTETAPKQPNDISMVAIGNLSAFQMIPEMPTLPDIDFAADVMKNTSVINDKSQAMNKTKSETIQTEEKSHGASSAANLTTGIEANSKADRLSIWNKTVVAEKSRTNIDDEIYDCIKDNDNDINTYMDLSIQLNDDEMDDMGPTTENVVSKPDQTEPKFLICNPVSIRPSQFQMNETKSNDMTIMKDEIHSAQQSFKQIQLSSTKLMNDTARYDGSANVVENIEVIPQKCEAPSIYMPEMAVDTTKNMSKYFKANESEVKPPQPIASNDLSIFLLPKEDTDVLTMNFNNEKTDTALKPSNDISTFAIGNLSAFPMNPEMSKLPEIDIVTDVPKNISIINDKSQAMNRTKTETMQIEDKLRDTSIEETASITTDIKFNSIHIEEERKSPLNKIADADKSRGNIDDEFYNCIKDNDNDINTYLDLSIQLTEDEMADIGTKTEAVEAPKFLICNPVSIRPSQFPMNETKANDTTISKDDIHSVQQSFKEILVTPSKSSTIKQDNCSLIVVEDTEDLSDICKSFAKETRRETIHSPFKNRFATNPKLNETISAVKEIDPFDMHLQNAFLDDIDFIEYIKGLDYVEITTRVRAIELNAVLEMGNNTFDIDKQIGHGSFGYVYSGKNTKTGKMYAFKQERPANLWEFYISLEIASRIEDPKMLSGFMCVEHAMVGHNSSIFASELCEYGSLFDICNRHKSTTCRNLDEVIAMIFSEQMLSILDHLHASNIVHGDIKPDNFLVMKKLSYGRNELVIKLIDYGRSIDLNFFPPNQIFTSVINTKNFVCTEMLENKPWKHQIDLFCMASTMHTLICGKYMNVKKNDSLIRPYILTDGLSSYLNVPLWEHVLYSLINVPDHNALPDLQKLRLCIREAVVDKEDILQEKINKFNAILDC